MRSTLRPLAVLAIVVTIGLSGAGCSNGSAGSGDGTSGEGHASTTRDKAVQFAECMRDNGVSTFPDPDVSGELTMDGIANGTSLDTDSTAFKKALSSCKDLQPPGFTGRKRNARTQKVALKFAQCIREHGVEDFPDPVEGEPLVDTNRIPSANEKGGMSILNAAMNECGKVYAADLGLKGP